MQVKQDMSPLHEKPMVPPLDLMAVKPADGVNQPVDVKSVLISDKFESENGQSPNIENTNELLLSGEIEGVKDTSAMLSDSAVQAFDL